jgi:hypothetical protein
MDAATRDYLRVRSDRRTSRLSALLAFRVAEMATALPGQGEEVLELVDGVWDEARAEGFEEGKESAYHEGYEEGKADGRAEAALEEVRSAGDASGKAVREAPEEPRTRVFKVTVTEEDQGG